MAAPLWQWRCTAVGLVLAVCLASYYNALWCGMVFDDHLAIEGNADCNTSATSWGSVFHNDFWGRPLRTPESHGSYRPLVVWSFRLNFALAGLEPAGYHGLNVALHGVASLLVLRLCLFHLQFPGRQAPPWTPHERQAAIASSALGAGLFAAHPVHTEAVTSLVGRSDVMCLIFFLCAFFGYWRTISAHRCLVACGWFGCFALCGLCAVLCKETAVTVLALCCLYDVVAQAQAGHRWLLRPGLWLRCTANAGLGAAYLGFRAAWVGAVDLRGSALLRQVENPLLFLAGVPRALSLAHVQVRYLRLLVWPHPLLCEYSYNCLPAVTALSDPRNLWAAGGVGLAAAGVRWAWADARGGGAPWLLAGAWVLLPYLPASHLVVTVGTLLGERLLYLPSIGLSLLATALLFAALRDASPGRGARKAVAVTVAGLLVVLGVHRTHARNKDWVSDETLFGSAVAVCPEGAKLHQQLGLVRLTQHRVADAEQHFQRARRIYPEWCEPAYHLARVALARLQWDAALAHLHACARDPQCSLQCFPLFHELIQPQLDQQNATAWARFAEVLGAVGQRANAVVCWREAAVLHLRRGRLRKALRRLEDGLRLAPEACDLLYWKGVALHRMGSIDQAAEVLEQVLRCPERKAARAAADELLGIYQTFSAEYPEEPHWHEKAALVLAALAHTFTDPKELGTAPASPASLGVEPTGSPPADETAGPAVANLAIQQLYRAGRAYFGRGQFSAAARMFRLILDHFEGFPCEVRYWLGEALLGTGDVHGGRAHLKAAAGCKGAVETVQQELQGVESGSTGSSCFASDFDRDNLNAGD